MSEVRIDKKIFADRKRTNILSNIEQRFITYLLPKIPNWLSSDGLTTIGFIGSLLVLVSFILGEFVDRNFLFLAVLGFFVQWFGDSLDGRIAFFRNKSRKWYGFALDIIMDWISTVLIGLGYVFYATGDFKYSGFVLVALYGWAMIISQLRYKITDLYTIDSGLIGPTEVRVILSFVIMMEVFFVGSINYLVTAFCIGLFFVNIGDTIKLLRLGDERDRLDKLAKEKKNENN